MSKTARQAAGYRPSGRQCAECHYAKHDCSGLEFDQMPLAGKRDADGVQRVACSYYVRDAGGVVTVCQRGHFVDADKMVKPCRCADSACLGRRDGEVA